MDLKEVIEKAKEKGMSSEEIKKELLKKGYSNEEIDNAFGRKSKQITKTKKISQVKEIEWQEKLKLLFIEPTNVFKKINDKNISQSLILYTIILFIVTAIGFGLSTILGRYLLGGVFSSFLSIFYLIFWIIILFICSGIIHLTIIVFKGEGSYVDTFNVVAYSLIPTIILMIIPLIGGLAIIYSIVLMVFGLAEYHKISYGKAISAILSPIIILVVIIILLFIILISRFRFF